MFSSDIKTVACFKALYAHHSVKSVFDLTPGPVAAAARAALEMIIPSAGVVRHVDHSSWLVNVMGEQALRGVATSGGPSSQVRYVRVLTRTSQSTTASSRLALKSAASQRPGVASAASQPPPPPRITGGWCRELACREPAHTCREPATHSSRAGAHSDAAPSRLGKRFAASRRDRLWASGAKKAREWQGHGKGEGEGRT